MRARRRNGKKAGRYRSYSPFTVTSILDVRIGDDSVAVFTRHSYLPLAPLLPTTVSTLWATHNPEYEKYSSDVSESTLRY